MESHELTMPEPNTVAEIVKWQRRYRKWSLQRLAEASGCSRSFLSLVERGRQLPRDEKLARLESVLGLASGTLISAARWARTPTEVQARVARLESLQRATLEDDDPSMARQGMEIPLMGGVRTSSWMSGPDGAVDGSPEDDGVARESIRWPGIDDPGVIAARVMDDAMSPAYLAGDIVLLGPAGRTIPSGRDCLVRLSPGRDAATGASLLTRVYLDEGPTPRRGGEPRETRRVRLQALDVRIKPRHVSMDQVLAVRPVLGFMRQIAGGSSSA
jgi:transcriptional regulator with XRE-family HTH domain